MARLGGSVVVLILSAVLGPACDRARTESRPEAKRAVAEPVIDSPRAIAQPTVAMPAVAPPPIPPPLASTRSKRVPDSRFDVLSTKALSLEIDTSGIDVKLVVRAFERSGALAILQSCSRRWRGRQQPFTTEFLLGRDGKPSGMYTSVGGSPYDCMRSALKPFVLPSAEPAAVTVRVRRLPEPTSTSPDLGSPTTIEATGISASELRELLEKTRFLAAIRKCGAGGWKVWLILGDDPADMRIDAPSLCIVDDRRCRAAAAPIQQCLSDVEAKNRVTYPGGAYATLYL